MGSETGTETVTIGPEGLPARAGDPAKPWKDLGALARAYANTESAALSLTFDDIHVNGTLYDDFSSHPISSSKWNYYEFVREIFQGKLRSKSRSSVASTSSINNYLEVVDPVPINNFKAKVTLMDYQNPQGLYELADLSGVFYNDGTPGGGRIGDVVGEVLIGGTGAMPVAQWRVYKYLDTAGTVMETLAAGGFTTPVILGHTYTLFLGWNAGMFTLKFESEKATYTPVSNLNPPNLPFKRLRTYIIPEGGKTEGTIEALFDDVVFSFGPVWGDLNSDGEVDLQDAILALQVLSGLYPTGIRMDYATSGADVDGDNKLGLAELIFILQTVGGIR